METPNLPTGFTVFANQVAGHMFQEGKQGLLSPNSPDDHTVLKPVQHPPKGEVEVRFYKTLFHDSRDHKDATDYELLSFVPHFFGLVTLPLGDGLEKKHLKLEDITKPFKLPALLDVKMGLKVWEDHGPRSKIERERKKFPLQEVIGFRILGMKVYNHVSSAYKFYDRFYGRTLLSEELIYDTLKMYVDGAPKCLQKEITIQIISRLRKILNWFECQRKYKFVASSLLIVYESSGQTKTECFTPNDEGRSTRLCEHCYYCGTAGQEKKDLKEMNKETLDSISSSLQPCNKLINRSTETTLVDIRIIDFTHVSETKDYDGNFAAGLGRLISFFEKIHTVLQCIP